MLSELNHLISSIQEPYKPWFDESYKIYPTDKPSIEALKKQKSTL